MKNLLVRFAKSKSGATAVEYGVIVAGISIAIVTIVFSIGGKLGAAFTSIAAMLP
ncbi:Flp family type IVb pilin [Candidatus Bathyarchaeota archaeon]|jgi:pilus assembly protein Flp/PilA|nr:Flp family type IVb pilin [Candidatus Bathyarchaeota archaeon]